MIPFAPHLAYECLELLNVVQQISNGRTVDKENVIDEMKLAVQVNGKTRDVD